MKYAEPKLTDLNQIGLTAHGACAFGSTATALFTDTCVGGTGGPPVAGIDCTGGSAAARTRCNAGGTLVSTLYGCVGGDTASGAPAGTEWCSGGNTVT
jgi:hypothetical protein